MPRGNEINFKVNVTYGDTLLTNQNSPEVNLYMFILWGIMIPLVATVGLIGNILTIIVLWRREMHSTTILYLRGMVLTDTGILITSVITLTPFSCANYLHGAALQFFMDVVYPHIYTPGYYIMMTLQQCNVWITVSVSIERYIAICHPFRASRLITQRKTVIVLVTIIVVSLIYNIPHIFAHKALPCAASASGNSDKTEGVPNDDSFNGRHVSDTVSTSVLPPTTLAPPVTSSPSSLCFVLASTEFAITPFYLNYRSILYSIIIYVIPFMALLILNTFLIKELMVMQRRRSGTNIHDENEANLSLVLVLIVIVFIFCQTPGLVAQFDLLPMEMFLYFLPFSNLLFTTNSAVNFLIYTAFGRKFRRVLLRVFRHMFKGKQRNSQSSFYMTQYTETDFDADEPAETQCQSIRGRKKDKRATQDTAEIQPLTSKEDTPPTLANGNTSISAFGNGKGHTIATTTDVEGEEVTIDNETIPTHEKIVKQVTLNNCDSTISSDVIDRNHDHIINSSDDIDRNHDDNTNSSDVREHFHDGKERTNLKSCLKKTKLSDTVIECDDVFLDSGSQANP